MQMTKAEKTRLVRNVAKGAAERVCAEIEEGLHKVADGDDLRRRLTEEIASQCSFKPISVTRTSRKAA
jgi:hypothetical protein